MKQWKKGDRVIIHDSSEAHGDHGYIYHIQTNGVILVHADEGYIWPLLTSDELRDDPTDYEKESDG